jgi:isoleucyl-tRNA synthetase
MAEDIWQNLPYPVGEASVFERGWPDAPEAWITAMSPEETAAIALVRDRLRPAVNRLLESARAVGQLGSSLEAWLQLEGLPQTEEPGDGARLTLEPIERVLNASAHPDVDNLADWLLVSQLQIGGMAPQALLGEGREGGVVLRVARADGEKCDRCWHYEGDVQDHLLNDGSTGRLCGRCDGILQRLEA